MKVRWGNTISSSFWVDNGIKQGGILSPVLFNIYMDKLSIALNDTAIGDKISGQLLNHLCYADDMCLISMSSSGMQQLLNVCHSFLLRTRYCIMEQSHTHCVLTLYDPGGGALNAPPLRFFALTHLILELHYCELGTFPKN